jgi:hypothetical protein
LTQPGSAAPEPKPLADDRHFEDDRFPNGPKWPAGLSPVILFFPSCREHCSGEGLTESSLQHHRNPAVWRHGAPKT